ncbi:hypothetical protein ACH3XW_37805 [Acanthocheilonema viteae]
MFRISHATETLFITSYKLIMKGIAILVALTIFDVCYPFYMIARPGGLFRLRNDMNHGPYYYQDRNKKALFLNDPYRDNYYNHDYGHLQPMMDFSIENGNGQGMAKLSVPSIPQMLI